MEIYDFLGKTPCDGMATVKAWSRWLWEVPADLIQQSFDLVMTNFKGIPTPEKVIAAYRDVRKKGDWKTDEWLTFDNGEQVLKGCYYSLESLPCRTPRMEELLQKNAKNELTEQENYEFHRMQTKRYWFHEVHKLSKKGLLMLKEFNPVQY